MVMNPKEKEFFETISDNDNSKKLRRLIPNTEHLECRNGYKQTLLMFASEKGAVKCLKLLIENKADVDAREGGYKERRALHFAADSGNTECVKELLRKNAKIDALTKYGHTPLSLASRRGHLETVKVLLRYKANTETLDCECWTALHWAAWYGHTECVKCLKTE